MRHSDIRTLKIDCETKGAIAEKIYAAMRRAPRIESFEIRFHEPDESCTDGTATSRTLVSVTLESSATEQKNLPGLCRSLKQELKPFLAGRNAAFDLACREADVPPQA